MNFPDALLVFSAISYLVFTVYPRVTLSNIKSLILEKVLSGFHGIAILFALLLDNGALFLGLGIWWTMAACMSYLGYAQWKIAYKKEPSDIHQVAMFCWDMIIALCFLTKSCGFLP